MFDMFGVGLQAVVDLILVGMALGVGIKITFEIIDYVKLKYRQYQDEKEFERDMRAHPELYETGEHATIALEEEADA